MTQDKTYKMATQTVWAGEERLFEGHATQTPVVHSVAFGYTDMEEWMDVALGKKTGHIYGRNTNPTVEVFEEKVRVLEGAEAATSASTGMGIISSALFALLAPGDRVVSVKDTYGGTNLLFTKFLPRQKVDVTLCDTVDHGAIEAEVAKGCKVLYLETPTNPTIKILDLERLAKAGREVGAIVMVDNTFATPINQTPLALGADLVLHSATKFLGGHADALGGVAAGKADIVKQIFGYREIAGATLHPMAAYLLLRGNEDPQAAHRETQRERHGDCPIPGSAPRSGASVLPGPGVPPGARHRAQTDARLRRNAQLRGQGQHLRGRLPLPGPAEAGAPRRASRLGGDHRRPPGHHQPRGVHGRGARCHGHPREPHPLLRGHRGRGGPEGRPGAGPGLEF